MQSNKIKNLEKLVFDACQKIQHLEKENTVLKLQITGLNHELEKLQSAQIELRKIKMWRSGLKSRLRKVAARMEKAIEKSGSISVAQPELFSFGGADEKE